MKSCFAFRPHFYCPNQCTHTIPSPKSTHILPTTPNSLLKHPSDSTPAFIHCKITIHPKQGSKFQRTTLHSIKPPILESTSKPNSDLQEASSSGFSRWVFLGAASLGFAIFLAGIDAPKALAFGPEGPLVEEFWDNMRRYGLYFLTVSTGAIYTIFQPIVELLKNPISAILIIFILGSSFYLVSQVLTAMFGISEFAYDYGY